MISVLLVFYVDSNLRLDYFDNCFLRCVLKFKCFFYAQMMINFTPLEMPFFTLLISTTMTDSVFQLVLHVSNIIFLEFPQKIHTFFNSSIDDAITFSY